MAARSHVRKGGQPRRVDGKLAVVRNGLNHKDPVARAKLMW